VTLNFKNNGTAKHEAILGDDAAQMRHHAEMTGSTAAIEHGNMPLAGESTDTDGDAITVDPGKSGQITHTFNDSTPVMIGCHEPGHWGSGHEGNGQHHLNSRRRPALIPTVVVGQWRSLPPRQLPGAGPGTNIVNDLCFDWTV
jgi:hypothetical protein